MLNEEKSNNLTYYCLQQTKVQWKCLSKDIDKYIQEGNQASFSSSQVPHGLLTPYGEDVCTRICWQYSDKCKHIIPMDKVHVNSIEVVKKSYEKCWDSQNHCFEVDYPMLALYIVLRHNYVGPTLKWWYFIFNVHFQYICLDCVWSHHIGRMCGVWGGPLWGSVSYMLEGGSRMWGFFTSKFG